MVKQGAYPMVGICRCQARQSVRPFQARVRLAILCGPAPSRAPDFPGALLLLESLQQGSRTLRGECRRTGVACCLSLKIHGLCMV